ncbi:DNA-3-methyladenine glycosylase family protein [Musicola paradisiaca]|uniref:DNA-3-methyladenine glycosylase II n=1 Tax=Musicola paradisiaca (strain Ech703) TaxID=579405 RepID=C6CD76_MUSP7|nr:DNA-3-methyladenine glycosylase [Musicola paradisiaca]ACS86947.1 DNA-3-methyladenine glycosylase II [Musicola paradisiaca Ech703]
MTTCHAPFDENLARSHLAAIDDRWERLIAGVGHIRFASRPGQQPYEALIRAVASQQLSNRAAAAIIAKLQKQFAMEETGFPSPSQLAECPPEHLRQCGFSSRKIDTVQAIARGAISGLVPDRASAALMEDDTLITQLCTLHGIGRWTVEMLLINTLERMDIMPVDDLGIRQGFRYLYQLPSDPSRKEMLALSAPCQPYRTLAAWYLWRIPHMPDYAEFRASLRGA